MAHPAEPAPTVRALQVAPSSYTAVAPRDPEVGPPSEVPEYPALSEPQRRRRWVVAASTLAAFLLAAVVASAWLNYRKGGPSFTRLGRSSAASAGPAAKYEEAGSYDAYLRSAERYKQFEGEEAAYEDAAHEVQALRIEAGQGAWGPEAVQAVSPAWSAPAPAWSVPSRDRCIGSTFMSGYGGVSMVWAGANTPGDEVGPVDIAGDKVICHMKGRTYFGRSCSPQATTSTEYVAMHVLGKTLRYTVDISGAQCGCNAAFYLTSMAQNADKSDCSDFYCDANKVCGVSCAEIDIQEANSRAWYSTLHTADDGSGKGEGYGANYRQWSAAQYGPGAQCIDTARPFQVAASFPVDANGMLKALEVTLTQEGKTCPLSVSVGDYKPHDRDGMAELTQALAQGMTPVISYWGKDENDMLWMDGKGTDGQGPCATDDASTCGESVTFSAFSIEDIVTAWLK